MSRSCALCHVRLLAHHRQLLLTGRPVVYASHTRGVAIVARVIRGVFKLRYLVLGSAVGGGAQLSRVSHVSDCVKLFEFQKIFL